MDLSIKKIDELALEEINRLSHEQMAHLVRFSPIGHKYFDETKPYYQIFQRRWQDLGGMTPELSKKIGWGGDN